MKRPGVWLLVVTTLCVRWQPLDSLGFCQSQRHPAAWRLARHSSAIQRSAEASQAMLTEEPGQRLLEDFEIGQNVTGRVKAVQVKGASVAYVDIGAVKDAVLEYGEMEDGFPKTLTPVKKGREITARVLEYDREVDRIYLTLRSGDISRPPRLRKQDENHDPESLRLVADQEWLEAEVVGIFTFGVFVNVKPSWGGGRPVFSLLHKNEFAPSFASDPDKAVRGGKIKVRKMGLNERGELKVTMKM
mmetsp:Transcript_10931/g.20593  ORF Transcript_10931/g.20593 Transcript_10931/m.20593 type:complete len:245 (+) Transcript_10931:44-778(+)